MTSTTHTDTMTAAATALFERMSSSYERSTGGCTREVAQHLLTLSPPLTSPCTIHDNACGTGIMTDEILKQKPSSSRPPEETYIQPSEHTIHATDIAPPMISTLQSLCTSSPRWSNVHPAVMDAHSLTFPDETFHLSYTNLGILFCADPEKVAREIYRTVRPSGTAFLTTWSTIGYLPYLRAVEKIIRPDLSSFVLPIAETWFEDGYLEDVLVAGGFSRDNIEVTKKHVWFRAGSGEELVSVIEGTFGGMVMGRWEESEKKRFQGEMLKLLTEEERREGRVGSVAFVGVARK